MAKTTHSIIINGDAALRLAPIIDAISCAHQADCEIIFAKSESPNAILTAMKQATGATISVVRAGAIAPLDLILRFIEKWKGGYEIVYGLRQLHAEETWLKLVFKRWLKRLFRARAPIFGAAQLPLYENDFLLMDRRVADAFLAGGPPAPSGGFRQTGIFYEDRLTRGSAS